MKLQGTHETVAGTLACYLLFALVRIDPSTVIWGLYYRQGI